MNGTDGIENEMGWRFDNSYARLPEIFYSKQHPAPASAPKLAVLNETVAASLGLNVQSLQTEEGTAVFAGNRIPAGALPLAQAYAGHQFGHLNMLGDGRALLIGEQITPDGERFDIQLKGSGRTPYSRGGDGRAALGPMLREYIISEAMHALGIPTTRSLAVTTTGESIFRETELPGAVLTRVAASHLRVGTFVFAAGRGTIDELRAMADYAWERHFAGGQAGENANENQGGNRYLSLLQEVIKRQASLIAKWQLVGFIHGVMNTDNMAISGETIDYGPCAFMDAYDPATVFSSIDRQGRYAYGNQPQIGAWNLARFAETLLPLLHDDEEQAVKLAEDAIAAFPAAFHAHWLDGMRAKLGLLNEEAEDEALIDDLLDIMRKHRADYTNTFRALTFDEPENTAMFGTSGFTEWHERWQTRRGRQQALHASSQQLMQASNPAVIPRNHRVEEALEAAAAGDYGVMERLLAALANPFAHAPEQEAYCSLPDDSSAPYRTFCGT
ncbi:protein adenylyltransferase SelO [Paenibacillus rhizovicinus]|nr:YdiU family protein [Paenibacillus rhizovicinus]